MDMDFKEILSKGLKDGLGEFFNSVTEQIQEQSQEALNEVLNMYYTTLNEIVMLLKQVGGYGEFDKSIKKLDDLKNTVYLVALIVSGQQTDEIKKLSEETGNHLLYDLHCRWEQTKEFLESEAFKPFALEATSIFPLFYTLFAGPNLTKKCDTYFENILNLVTVNEEKGLFAVRKMKKKIQPYSEDICVTCGQYSSAIQLILENTD